MPVVCMSMAIELGGWVLNWITMANILYYIVMPLLHFSERKWDWNLSSSHREPSSFRKCVTEKSWTCGWTWPPPGGWVGTSMSCLQALKQKLRSRCILCSPDSARAESGHRAKQGVEMGKKFFLLALVNGINERCEF